MRCCFCARKSSLLSPRVRGFLFLLPYVALSGLVLDWVWENPGADQLTAARPSATPIHFISYVFKIASGSQNIRSSSHLLGYDLCSYNIRKYSPECNNSKPFITFWHWCHYNIKKKKHSNITLLSLLCFAPRITTFFKAPKLFPAFWRVSWRHTCWRVNTLL